MVKLYIAFSFDIYTMCLLGEPQQELYHMSIGVSYTVNYTTWLVSWDTAGNTLPCAYLDCSSFIIAGGGIFENYHLEKECPPNDFIGTLYISSKTIFYKPHIMGHVPHLPQWKVLDGRYLIHEEIFRAIIR